MADEPNDQGGAPDQPPPDASPAPAGSYPPAADVRNSPEYQELARQNRALARKAGAAEAAATRARTDAELARQAAEAERAAALESEVRSVLGDEGVAAWGEIAELSATDQVAAARKFAEMMAAAQNRQPDPSQAAAATATTTQEPPVTAQPPRRVDASVPLSQGTAAPDDDAYIAELEDRFAGVVKRVQDPTTRNRVTMKERAAGAIAFIEASYRKAGVRPRG